MTPRYRSFLGLTAIALLAGCGGGDDSVEQEAGFVASDSLVQPMEREPLTEADMVGLDMADLSVQLPWTDNRVSRDAAQAAAAATVLSLETADHGGFARAVFEFGTTTPFPGYRIEVIDGGSGVSCGEDPEPIAVSGARILTVSFTPARADDLGSPGEGFEESRVVCSEANTVVWAAGLSEASQIRVLELRGPPRLAVDVR